MASTSDQNRRAWTAWIGPLVLILIVTAVNTVLSFRAPLDISGDQRYLGVIVYEDLMPENYARNNLAVESTMLGDIPAYSWYIWPLTQLTRISGSYEQALAWMMLPTTLAFLIGMTLLLYRMTGSRWISVLVALLSTAPHDGPLKGDWGPMLNVIEGSQARGIYLALVPFLILAFLDLLDKDRPERPAWLWGLMGLGFGLITNFHPPSGIGIGVATGLIVGLALLRKDLNVKQVGFLGMGMLIGLLPYLIPYIQNMVLPSVEQPAYNFQTYLSVVYNQASRRIIPWDNWQTDGILSIWWIHIIPYTWVLIGIGLHIVLSAVTGIGFWRSRRLDKMSPLSRRYLWGFVLVQVVVVSVLFVDQIWMAILLIAYTADTFFYGELDTHDRRLFEMIAGLFGLFILTLTIQVIWISFESESLSSWAAFLQRGTRFIYLPLFIFIARLCTRLQKRDGWIVAGAVLLTLTMSGEIIHLMLGGVLLVLSIYWSDKTQRPPYVQAVIYGLACAIYVERLMAYVQLEYPILTYLLTFYVVTAYVWLIHQWPALRKKWFAAATTAIWIVLVFLIPMKRYGDADGSKTLAAALPELTRVALEEDFLMDRQPYLEKKFADEYDVGLWARAETSPDALFMLRDGSNFRYYAQRSVTHAEKDLSAKAFSHGGAWLITYAQRLHWLQEAFHDPVLLVERSREVDVDYVIVEKKIDVRLDWPVVYSNDAYIVYEVVP
jgi:hypothetical protein